MAGRVKGLKAGQATILVAAGKLSSVCTVTVKPGGDVRDGYVAGDETQG